MVAGCRLNFIKYHLIHMVKIEIIKGVIAILCILLGLTLYTYETLHGKSLFEGVIIGFILGVGATVGNEVIKQIKKK